VAPFFGTGSSLHFVCSLCSGFENKANFSQTPHLLSRPQGILVRKLVARS